MMVYKLQIYGDSPETRIFAFYKNAVDYATSQTDTWGGAHVGNGIFLAKDDSGERWRIEPFNWPSKISRKKGMSVNF